MPNQCRTCPLLSRVLTTSSKQQKGGETGSFLGHGLYDTMWLSRTLHKQDFWSFDSLIPEWGGNIARGSTFLWKVGTYMRNERRIQNTGKTIRIAPSIMTTRPNLGSCEAVGPRRSMEDSGL